MQKKISLQIKIKPMMTLDDAFNILGSKEDDKDKEIESNYKKLLNDYQILLNNHYQPAQKQIYKQKIEDLKVAYDLILRDRSRITTSGVTPPPPTPITTPTPPPPPPPPPDIKKGKKNKEKVLLLILIIVVVFGSSAFLILIDFYNKTRIELQVRNLKINELSYKDSIFSNSLENVKMKILNNSGYEITITNIKVLFFKDGMPVFFTTDDKYRLKIGNGEEVSPEIVGKWDGSTYYYVIRISLPSHVAGCQVFLTGCVKDPRFINGTITTKPERPKEQH